jgi:hypothetical protein
VPEDAQIGVVRLLLLGAAKWSQQCVQPDEERLVRAGIGMKAGRRDAIEEQIEEVLRGALRRLARALRAVDRDRHVLAQLAVQVVGDALDGDREARDGDDHRSEPSEIAGAERPRPFLGPIRAARRGRGIVDQHVDPVDHHLGALDLRALEVSPRKFCVDFGERLRRERRDRRFGGPARAMGALGEWHRDWRRW